MSQWEKPRELVDAERKNRNSTDDDDVVILAETAWKSDIEKTKDDDEPMIVEELICIDGPVKESTRSDIIEPEEAFLDENAGPENPSRRMRTEERKNNKSHEGEYFETCEEFMKKEQEKELLEGAVNVPESELKLREIVVDGSNVAMALGKHKTFRVDAAMPQLSTTDQKRVTKSWEKLRTWLEKLPRQKKNLPPMKILDLPKQEDVVPLVPDHLMEEEDVSELTGDRYPEVVEDADFGREEDKLGMGVVVYTDMIESRPWVGRIIESLDRNRFKIH